MTNERIMSAREAEERFDFEISRYTELEFVKDRLIYKLVNYKNNEEKIKNMPYRRFLDLAMIYGCAFKSAAGENGSIAVMNDHLKYWGIEEKELHNYAVKNTPQLMKGRIRPLLTALSDIAGYLPSEAEDAPEMYICSNSEYFYGAGCMLYDGLLRDFAKKEGCDLIILPSSVHELILLPDRGEHDYGRLEKLVDYVNKTEVSPREILSDKIYKYVLSEDEINIIFVTIL